VVKVGYKTKKGTKANIWSFCHREPPCKFPDWALNTFGEGVIIRCVREEFRQEAMNEHWRKYGGGKLVFKLAEFMGLRFPENLTSWLGADKAMASTMDTWRHLLAENGISSTSDGPSVREADHRFRQCDYEASMMSYAARPRYDLNDTCDRHRCIFNRKMINPRGRDKKDIRLSPKNIKVNRDVAATASDEPETSSAHQDTAAPGDEDTLVIDDNAPDPPDGTGDKTLGKKDDWRLRAPQLPPSSGGCAADRVPQVDNTHLTTDAVPLVTQKYTINSPSLVPMIHKTPKTPQPPHDNTGPGSGHNRHSMFSLYGPTLGRSQSCSPPPPRSIRNMYKTVSPQHCRHTFHLTSSASSFNLSVQTAATTPSPLTLLSGTGHTP
jgi:hypothetical protein